MVLNLETSQYFKSLSKFAKESIMQSGIDFNDEEELRSFAKNINHS